MGLKIEENSVIFFDKAPLIYFFEKNDKYYQPISDLIDVIYKKNAQMLSSLITYIEITTYPAKAGNNKLIAKYRDFFTNSENFSLYPLDISVSDLAVKNRIKYGFRTPDSIQLATAEFCGADFVITNDVKWKQVKGLKIVLVKEL